MLCTNIFSNVLDGTNLDGWQELTEVCTYMDNEGQKGKWE